MQTARWSLYVVLQVDIWPLQNLILGGDFENKWPLFHNRYFDIFLTLTVIYELVDWIVLHHNHESRLNKDVSTHFAINFDVSESFISGDHLKKMPPNFKLFQILLDVRLIQKCVSELLSILNMGINTYCSLY